ncbi:hypothetical protein SAICODRAFT_31682 [Saitoella complicata NRRL Y-17804]|uniref:uncharacterized protein n=1 Tax=Saitoella complicata (strain BCRC 22490 / CBS 7301 / JCM 7358 / NBRC 10748 / NRRL Y-17804) TaxID=698492 RepID=UPI0008672B13|nr:uncharacterized protein SAICODRAFT_31682 [Saitoella complicata NRRL Y-17804]ODQ50933.1 hypothetical protein SAICODRAFT_31682 [Saitoella complicata NRRL Y-17804]
MSAAESTMPTESAAPAVDPTATTASSGQQDYLDKGVAFAAQKAGHSTNASTTEKISDGIRSGFKKLTGKDVPIADKQ